MTALLRSHLAPIMCISVSAVLGIFAIGCVSSTGEEVVVYVAVDRGDAEPILNRFQSETGITVRAIYDAEAAKTTGLVHRLLSEVARPRCDVFWNNEVVQTILLAERDVLEEYHSPQAKDIAAKWKDPHGRWVGQATRNRVIIYNTQYVSADQIPRKIDDLTDQRWKGRIAIANPQFGSTRTHIAALFAVRGPSNAQEFIRNLTKNQVRIVDGNAMVKNLVARAHPGASPILLGLTDSDDVASALAAGEPVGSVVPDQDTFGTLVFPTTVSIVRNAPHMMAAKRLAEYLLTPIVIEQFAHQKSGYTPLHSKAIPMANPIRGFDVSFSEIYGHLASSTNWTAEHMSP